MPILQNLNALTMGSRISDALALTPPLSVAPPVMPPAAAPPVPSAPASAATPPVDQAAMMAGSRIPFMPILPILPTVPPTPQPVLQSPVTTLARGAMAQLSSTDGPTLAEAIRTISNQRLTGDTLMDYLERKVRIGEVLGNRATEWSDTTKADFAGQSGAFQMMPDRPDIMDAIVSIAILNDRNLEADIRGENSKETTADDLLKNRKIVWQSPPAGTVLTPPYIVVIAVEYQEVATAETVVSSIRDQLGDYQGFKLPKSAIQKL